MNIIEAIKSGKRFRRHADIPGTKRWLGPLNEQKDWDTYFQLWDILADDWEIMSEPVTITREQFDQACENWLSNYSPDQIEAICNSGLIRSQRLLSDILVDLAKELGL